MLELPELNFGALANGRQQLLATVRHQLYLGATQIKIATGGGVSSYADPLYVNEFVHEEIEAVVRVTEDYGTYVAVHVFNPVGSQLLVSELILYVRQFHYASTRLQLNLLLCLLPANQSFFDFQTTLKILLK